jgi:3-phytase/alkaline phosphatase D
MFSRARSRSFLFVLFLLSSVLLVSAAGDAAARPAPSQEEQLTVADVDSLGVVTFPTGHTFAGTEVGGLSGITYDAQRGVYYVLSDDRSEEAPARFYTVAIDLSDGQLDAGDVTFLDVTFLREKAGATFPPGSVDPEGIQLIRPGTLYISSEGESGASPPLDPFVDRFNPIGRQNRALPVPEKFLPTADGAVGVRDNLAFESLTASPNRHALYTATENALRQDGPISTLDNGSPSRVLAYDLRRKQPGPEFVYNVDPIPQAPVPEGAFADNGLVELEALDNRGTLLAMERSFAVGVGNTIVLYETTTQGATDVSGLTTLTGAYTPMDKRLVADFETDLGVTPDNVEGLGFGPLLPDGRQLLIAVSDNNFNPFQTTQFIALAVDLEAASGD